MRFSPPLRNNQPIRPRPRSIALPLAILICIAWLLLGLTDHAPWKPGEGRTLLVIDSLLRGDSWPLLHGHPYFLHLPLYHLVGAACVRLFGSWLAQPDAARLASGIFGALALWWMALAARATYGEGHGRIAALTLIGCLGLLVKGHMLMPETALVPAACLILYAAALLERPLLSGLVAAGGVTMAFFAKGAPEALALLLPVLLAPLVARRHQRGPALKVAGIALLGSAIVIAVWAGLAATWHPALLRDWWSATLMRLEVARPADSALLHDPTYYLRILPWYAWPAWPIAAWGVWQMQRTGIFPHGARVALLALLLWLPLATLFNPPREADAMFLLPAFALLACGGAGSLRRSAASALDWFGAMTMGLFGFLCWLAWLALATGHPARIAHRLYVLQPNYIWQPDWPATFLAAVLTGAWLAILLGARRSPWRSLTNWAAGFTMIWGLSALLLFPYLDSGKSYQSMVAAMMRAVPAQHGCINSMDVYAPQRSLIEYYSGLVLRPADRPRPGCDLFLVQGRHITAPDGTWQQLWAGQRPSDRSEHYVLYQREQR